MRNKTNNNEASDGDITSTEVETFIFYYTAKMMLHVRGCARNGGTK
jgi:hypothetical protein